MKDAGAFVVSYTIAKYVKTTISTECMVWGDIYVQISLNLRYGTLNTTIHSPDASSELTHRGSNSYIWVEKLTTFSINGTKFIEIEFYALPVNISQMLRWMSSSLFRRNCKCFVCSKKLFLFWWKWEPDVNKTRQIPVTWSSAMVRCRALKFSLRDFL